MKRIRLQVAAARGETVSQTQFAQLVAEAVGLSEPFAQSTAGRWELGAEPGLLAGIGIATLGGVPAEALVFADVEPPAAAIPPGTPAPIIMEGMGPGRINPVRAATKRRRDQAG